jgi:D-glycero-D-manno-heptose 1,7-bisphosphate phosphatase
MSLAPPKVIVLDRDGVINEDSPDSIATPAAWQPRPGSLAAIARLYQAGYLLTISTAQPGVGRGEFSIDTLWQIHQKMLAQIAAAGGYIEKIFFCLHTPEDHCYCRKPQPGLLLQVAEVFGCGFANMIVIGGSARDIEAARAVGAAALLVRPATAADDAAALADNLPPVFADLGAAADALLANRVSVA